MEILTVLDTLTDHTDNAFDFTRDSFTVSYVTSEFIHIGYRKQFKDIYIDIATVGTSIAGAYEYFNGSTWEALTVLDDTKSMTRSGFLFFTAPSDWATTTVMSIEKYYIRYSQDVTEPLIFNGINTVFASDADLAEKYRTINQFLINGDVSFIATHQAVKKHIIQKLRNGGNFKVPSDTGIATDITEWDFLDRAQLTQAAAWYALQFIFENVSDSIDGKFFQLSRDYQHKGDDAFNLFIQTLDTNDDGVEDLNESFSAVRLHRVVRV